MNFQERIKRSFKPRFAVIYPFSLFLLIFGVTDEHSLHLGMVYIIAGILIRLWSNGYAIKNDKLTTSGPYGFIRNPLYLGTFLIIFGFIVILKVHYLIGILFMSTLILVYRKTIQDEEKILHNNFGKAFEEYCSNVPAMIPRLTPYPKGEKWPFNLERLIRSKEHKTIIWLTVIIIIFHIKSRIFIEHKDMTPKTWGLVLIAALLIMLDVLSEINKKKK